MKTREREKDSRDSTLLMLLILLVGFICIIVTSGWALRFAPNWKLPANMGSNLNPDSDFLVRHPGGFIEPLDPAILTQPAWLNVFLTPGASFLTRTPIPRSTNTSPVLATNTNTSAPPSSPTNTLVPTNTVIYIPPPATTKPPTATREPPTDTPQPPPNTPTPTASNTPPVTADLQITKTDNATDYAANVSVQYVILAANAGPSNVTGATVSDAFSANLTSITWTCTGSGGASCTASGSGNINDTAVTLPVGGSVQYTVNAAVIASPGGTLVNTAAIAAPPGVTDPNPANNSATDTDQLIVSDPPGNIGPAPDGSSTIIPAGTYTTLQFGTPLVVGGHASWDLVYYETLEGSNPGILMDAVILQIGDGRNWYTILDWGNTILGGADTNTNIAVPLASPPNPTNCAGEPDNCEIDASLLISSGGFSTGVGINVDGVVPNGTYSFIRIISPPNPPDTGNDGVDVDAVQMVP